MPITARMTGRGGIEVEAKGVTFACGYFATTAWCGGRCTGASPKPSKPWGWRSRRCRRRTSRWFGVAWALRGHRRAALGSPRRADRGPRPRHHRTRASTEGTPASRVGSETGPRHGLSTRWNQRNSSTRATRRRVHRAEDDRAWQRRTLERRDAMVFRVREEKSRVLTTTTTVLRPSKPRAGGVGDVAGERGDRAARIEAFNRRRARGYRESIRMSKSIGRGPEGPSRRLRGHEGGPTLLAHVSTTRRVRRTRRVHRAGDEVIVRPNAHVGPDGIEVEAHNVSLVTPAPRAGRPWRLCPTEPRPSKPRGWRSRRCRRRTWSLLVRSWMRWIGETSPA